MKRFVVGLAVLVTLALASSHAKALVLVPSDLNYGDQYHLVFVSTTQRDATSADIADYDAHVQGAADAAGIGVGSALGDISWKAIASTPTVDADDHIGVVAPVYRLDGTRIADDESDLWSGSIQEEISITETGSPVAWEVWTGTTSLGFGTGKSSLGGSDASATRGLTWQTNVYWVHFNIDEARESNNHLYGISEALTVVPEPSTIVIWSLLGALGLLWRRSR